MCKSRKLLVPLLLALCMCIALCAAPLSASALTPIDKVLATTSYVPVGTTPAFDITASVSTYGCYISSYGWFDNASGQQITGKFTADACHVELGITANEGFYFPENVTAYINNSDTYVYRESDTYIIVRRDYDPLLWEPNVIKSPGAETVTEGEWASFVATANYAAGYTWKLVSPDGKTTIKCVDAPSRFPGLTTSEDNTEKMNLYNIPAELDGWKILCTFKGLGASEVSSSTARITVEPIGGPPEATPVPDAEPETESQPDTAPADDTASDSGIDTHEHEFGSEWLYDDDFHRQECECGEISGEAVHSMNWTVTREATRKADGLKDGVCSVCGYRAQQTIEYKKAASDSVRLVLRASLALCVLAMILLTFYAVREQRRRARRRRKKQRMKRY